MNDINNTIEQIKEVMKNLEETVVEKKEKLTAEGKVKVEELFNKTSSAVNEAITKLESKNFAEITEEDFKNFSTKVVDKCKSAAAYTIDKVSLLEKEYVKPEINKIEEDIEQGFNDIFGSDNVKKVEETAINAVNKVTAFFEKPETQEKIDKAKDAVINVAEKALEGLRKLLNK